MKAKIVVTQAHIDKGTRKDAHFCPIALACQDAGFEKPKIFHSNIYVECPKTGRYSSISPDEASRFVRAFDRLGPGAVKPFSMTIDLTKMETL